MQQYKPKRRKRRILYGIRRPGDGDYNATRRLLRPLLHTEHGRLFLYLQAVRGWLQGTADALADGQTVNLPALPSWPPSAAEVEAWWQADVARRRAERRARDARAKAKKHKLKRQ